MTRPNRSVVLTGIRGTLLAMLAFMTCLGDVAMADESGPTADEMTAELRTSQRQVRLILGDVIEGGIFDAAKVLDVAGSDPEALARWVQDQTTHVPYRGVVRGEYGVLQDRLGNHLDRALLLGRLIEATGRAVRLEVMAPTGDVPPARSLEDRPRPQPVTLSDGVRDLLSRLGSLPDEPPPDTARLLPWKRFDQDLQARAVSLMDRLAEDPGFPAWHQREHQWEPSDDPGVRVWWEDDQEKWVSTNLSEGTVSTPVAAPSTDSQSLAAVSQQYAHHYEIEVVAERWQAGHFDRVTLLEHGVNAHELAMQPIRVGIVPDQLEVDGFYATDDDRALADDLLANASWLPYIRYGEELVLGDLIDEAGQVRDPAQPAQARQLEEATSLLGGISVGGRGEEETSNDAFIGLSLEVTHRHGDDVVNRLSRPWYSLASEDAPPFDLEREHRLDRALALLRDTNMVLQISEPSEALLLRHELGAFLRNAHGLQGVIMALEDEDFEALDGAIQGLIDLPATVLQFARHRFTASLHPGRFYIGEPNILIEHTGLKRTSEGMHGYRAIDLAHLPLHLTSTAGDSVQRLRFEQGVLETLLEAELLTLRNPAPDRRRVLDSENAAIHLETAMARGDTGFWLSPEDADRLSSLPLLGPSRQTMREQLARGHHLYFPLIASLDDWPKDDPFPLAWWAVDPLGGQTLGYGGMGWGNMSHYATLLHARLYVLRATLAPTVAKSAVGSSLVCAFAAALLSVQIVTAAGEPGLLNVATDQSERLLKFCMQAYNRRMNPRLPSGS